MCMKQTCPTCCKLYRRQPSRLPTRLLKSSTNPIAAKASWFGCGLHISRVMDVIPEAEWCQCAPKVTVDDKQYPPKAGTAK